MTSPPPDAPADARPAAAADTVDAGDAAVRATADGLALSGRWTAQRLGAVQDTAAAAGASTSADGSAIQALDTAGAWMLHRLLHGHGGTALALHGLAPRFAKLYEQISAQIKQQRAQPAPRPAEPGLLTRVGRSTVETATEVFAMLSFVGETALAAGSALRHPSQLRWRPVLFNIRSAGFNALPIVGLLAFLLGVVVAYQGADQLRLYGANIFVVDLVGVSMLREFAPLITAIIVAGRSGSAYAAQIGTMAVTEEIDAMRTLGIAPLQMLVLPKLLAMLVAMPLLTAYADAMGVAGGMLMAHSQLGIGYAEFIDRFGHAVSLTSYVVGIVKAPVFAVIITVVGCFQGFRTEGGADSVGRQTTHSVVQSIFLVIVADAAFSVAYSALDL